jgi:hypothetical protein
MAVLLYAPFHLSALLLKNCDAFWKITASISM